MRPYEDPDHPGNGPKHHTGKTCVERGCLAPAGTWWSPLWCFACNVERMRQIDDQMERLKECLAPRTL